MATTLRTVVLGLLLSWMVPARADAGGLNDVLGDASWTAAFGSQRPTDDEVLRIRTHLTYVLDRLRTRDVVRLLPEQQRNRRAAALAALERYIQRGVFPRRTGDRYEGRRPRFVDDLGTHCAVAQLIAESGSHDLVRAIRADHEYAFVRDITTPGLREWADATGLTLDELAMIQPSYSPPPTAASTRSLLEASNDQLALECERQHKPLARLAIHVRGMRGGAIEVTTKSGEPFARCVATLASKLERGGAAYNPSPSEYAFDMVLGFATAQRQLETALEKLQLPECLPGSKPRPTTIEVTSDQRVLEVRVTLVPDNAELATCLKRWFGERLARFGPGAWQLRARHGY